MKTFKPSRIATTVAVALGAALMPVATTWAQQVEQEAKGNLSEKMAEKVAAKVEVIEVKGIRSSVIKSMDIKRGSSGVVDAINADDIGKFPDTNLAESLQRITGVSIDRKNNEGNQISVRGFGPSFNLVTLNGRQMPAAGTQKQEGDSTAAQSRAFNFAEIASDSVAGVEVFKTARANVPTGGIGATVNILTTRPLDLPQGQKLVGSVKGIFDKSVEVGDDVTPEMAALFSTNIDNTFGFMLTGSYSERHNRQNTVATDGWLRVGDANLDTSAMNSSINPSGQIWMPRNLVVDQSDHNRERINGQAVLQYAPNDRLEVTIDYTFSEYDSTTQRSQTGAWFESPFPSGVTDETGSVTELWMTSNPANNYGSLSFQGYTDITKTENKSLGLNVEYQLTDSVHLTLDYHDSTSNAQPGGEVSDFLVIVDTPLGLTNHITYGNGLPTVDIQFDPSVSGASSWYDAGFLRPNIDLARNKSAENTVEQLQLNGSWNNMSDGALAKINFGLSKTEYAINTGWFFDLGVQGQPGCGQLCADFVTLDESHFPGVFPFIQTFNAQQAYTDVIDPNFPSVFDMTFTNENMIAEDTTALFVSFDVQTEFNGMPVNLNAGIRYEQTDVTGTTIQPSPQSMEYISTTEFRANMTADAVEYSLQNDYAYWLPSFDLSMEVTDDVMARFSVGRTLSRSDLNSMKPSLSVGDARPGGPYNAGQGNPGLLPYVSDNLDLALEWYYDAGSYVALNYFKKWVDNYVVTGLTQAPIMGTLGYELTDPNPSNDPNFPTNVVGGPDDQVIIWDIASYTNGEAAEVDGIEIALQHLFADSGFGIQANATFVDGDVKYDVTSLDQDISLTGLSDSANLVAFWEDDGFQVRLAYNWRDDFLLSQHQLRQMNEPVFIKAYGQWDLSASWDYSDNINVFIEAINITGEDAQAHGRYEQQFIYFDDQQARYAMGMRFKF